MCKQFRLQNGSLVKEDNGKYYLEIEKDNWKEIPKDLFNYFLGIGATYVK